MIRLRLRPTDLQRTRFAYSPLAETTESLYMLHSGRINPMHRGWYDSVRSDLARVDTPLLQGAVPARGILANLLVSGAVDARTKIEDQLLGVALSPLARVRRDLETVWRGARMPQAIGELLDRDDAGRMLAEDLRAYWDVAIAPFWSRIKGVLDGDVAARARRLAGGGIEAMLDHLHPELRLEAAALEVAAACEADHQLSGDGLLLVPSVFVWPDIVVDPGRTGPPSLTYGPQGIGTLWPTATPELLDQDDLGALIGRSRLAVLQALELPRSTTDVALRLRQSPASVSAHLTVLRRCGWATSWRSGHRVLYQRTPLAASVLAAATADTTIDAGTA